MSTVRRWDDTRTKRVRPGPVTLELDIKDKALAITRDGIPVRLEGKQALDMQRCDVNEKALTS